MKKKIFMYIQEIVMDRNDQLSGAQTEHFWFSGKRALIHNLLSFLPEKEYRSILDVGAGTGSDIEVIGKFGHIHVLDIDQEALQLINNACVVEKTFGSATVMPYSKDSFDVIVAFDVLEHIDDDSAVVKEMYRVLKPGGFIVVTVPAYQMLFSAHDKALGHVRRYNKKMLRALFADAEEKKMGYWFFTLFPLVALGRFINKNKNPKVDSSFSLPSWINNVLRFITKSEASCIKKGGMFPFGLTLYALYQKPE